MAPSKQRLNEILDILNANVKDSDIEMERLVTFNARNIDRIPNVNLEHNGVGDTCVPRFTFSNAWDMAQSTDLNSTKLLKTSLRADVDQDKNDHAI